MSVFQVLLGRAKKFKPPRSVKSIIASNFSRDAQLFIERFDILFASEGRDDKWFRAKVLLDLIMSIECSLKSLFISLSKDDEKPSEAYREARRLSHNISLLFEKCSERAKNRLKLPAKPVNIFKDIESLGISIRYSHELWLIRFNDSVSGLFFEDGRISRTIDDPVWAKELRSVAVMFLKLSEDAEKRFLSPHRITVGNQLNLRSAEIQKFFNETKKK
jgi:hypothetical protein